jgi:branched-chain amino acid aminotransferase
VSLAFHNGRFLPYSELAIAPHDAGFVFGATVTDFCRTYAHKLFRWTDHLARLRRDAEACFIPLPYSDAELTAAAETLVAENSKELPANDDLAVITFATPGPLGYMAGTDSGPPTLAMHTFPIPKERYRRFFTEGVVLQTAGNIPRGSAVPLWVKHRSRMHWWHAAHTTDTPRAVPTLVVFNKAVDTAVGAVLAVRNGVLVRPSVFPVFDSISMRVACELATSVGIEVRETNVWPGGKPHGEESELLLVGSAFGVAGVRAFCAASANDRLEYPWPGPVFTMLAAAWSDLVGVDIVKQFTG